MLQAGHGGHQPIYKACLPWSWHRALQRSMMQAAYMHKHAPHSSSCDTVVQAQAIKLICADVDGTLLNSKQEMTQAVKDAVQAADDAGIPVRLALSMYAELDVH
jgi:haloacid dehalogenase-like hydrolase